MEVFLGIIAALKSIPALVSLVEKVIGLFEMGIAAWNTWHKDMNEDEFNRKVKERSELISSLVSVNEKIKKETDMVKIMELRNERKKIFFNIYSARFN